MEQQVADLSVIRVFNPSNGELIEEIEDGGAAAIDRAVARARASFSAGVWRNLPSSERANIMWRLGEIMERRIDELAAVEALNTGMQPGHARNLVKTGIEAIRYYAGWCTKIQGSSLDIVSKGGVNGMPASYHAYTVKEPVGVAGLITPWNGPLYCAVMKIAPAMAAGCSSVLKPAELTPLFTPMLREMLAEAGVPEGVVEIVNGYGATAGAALAAHPDVDKIAFTGSTATGKAIVQAATGNLKRVMLELGGKSPVLIFDDADLPKAIAGAAMGIFLNSGQGCACGSRIYVQRGVYEQVVEGLAARAKTIRVGPATEEADIGPLISQRQLERVLGYIESGRQDGVDIVAGGARIDRPGYFVEPTVVTGATPDMKMFREEIFGPVVAVTPFDDEAEVVAEANASIYGLAAAVWTRDIGRAHRLGKALEAGTVWLNCQLALSPQMAFGGYKQSGWGREKGWDGLDAYLNTKSVYADIS